MNRKRRIDELPTSTMGKRKYGDFIDLRKTKLVTA
jgi:hypothetical protein